MLNEIIGSELVESILMKRFEGRYTLMYRLVPERNIFLVKDVQEKLYVLKAVEKDMTDIDRLNRLKSLPIQGLEKTVECTEDSDQAWIIKEYVRGRTLFDLVDEEGALDEYQAVAITKGIAKVLIDLHRSEGQIIYRDIHPKNIIITENNKPVLVDSDSVRCYREETSLDTVRIGAIGFIAPEQYGFTQSDHRSDIYSLGMVTYFMVTGQVPNFGNNGVVLESFDINERLKRILKKMTDFTPDRRYKDMKSVFRDLDRVQRELQGTPRFIALQTVAVILFGLGLTLFAKNLFFGDSPVEAMTNMTLTTEVDRSIEGWQAIMEYDAQDSETIAYESVYCRIYDEELQIKIIYEATSGGDGYMYCEDSETVNRIYNEGMTIEGDNVSLIKVKKSAVEQDGMTLVHIVPLISDGSYIDIPIQ